MAVLRLVARRVAAAAACFSAAVVFGTGCFGRSGLDDFGTGLPDGGVLGDGAAGSTNAGAGGATGEGGASPSGGRGGRGAGGGFATGGGIGDGGFIGAGGSVFGTGGNVFGAGGSVFGAGGNMFGAGGNMFGAGGNMFGAGGNVFGAGGNVFGAGGNVFGAGGNVFGAGGVVGAGGRTGSGGAVVTGGAQGAGGFTPVCSAATCSSGCCDARGQCTDGRTDASCGSSGQACANCTASGEACAPAGFCYTGAHCGPDNCAGCCTPTGGCRPGTAARNCGRYGAVCENCNSSPGETCQEGACALPGATCPGPYGGCRPGSETTPPTTSTACTAADLASVAKACVGTPPGQGCSAQLGSLARSNSGCFGCLAQFLYSGGVAKCLAPFLTTSCNESLTCALECAGTSCGQCQAADKQSCQDGTFAAGGTCNPYVGGYLCAAAAFGGSGSFCDLARIGDTGAFLRGVGAYYCSK